MTGFILLFQGVGVAGAHVYLDGKEQAVTKTDGTYHLDSMRVGTYTLVVKDRYLFFDPVTVKVTPNTPYLPDIVASRSVYYIHTQPFTL